MDPDWAGEHLQAIRTLMERSAVYRRALAPIMFALGLLGFSAGAVACLLHLNSAKAFVSFWAGISILAVVSAFILVRIQALKDSEPFWSVPTKRVAQALLPCLVTGAVAALLAIAQEVSSYVAWTIVPLWMSLYGAAVHAAGFFTPRGIKLFGWIFVISAMVFSCAVFGGLGKYPVIYANVAMGVFFGGYHIAYGVYLNMTEKRGNE